jgi:threonine-phosphate decarboxylase
LRGLGLEVTESETNFILFRAPGVSDLKERMRGRGMLIRSRAGFHGMTDDYYRVAVRTEAENGY